jgi:hypothetical protein
MQVPFLISAHTRRLRTLVNKENRIANKKTDDIASCNGHIVVRVEPGGATANVYVPSNEDETDRVLTTFGPYTS